MADSLVKININGHLSTAFPKLRGLKQDDPLPPILYKLAFEPFLLAIINDRQFQRYTMGSQRTKVLRYVDDALVFVRNSQDLTRLERHMALYYRASNAKFNNDNKVQAFSVSGRDTWNKWNQELSRLQITHLYSVKDDESLIYLEFPLIQSRIQRVNYVEFLLKKSENCGPNPFHSFFIGSGQGNGIEFSNFVKTMVYITSNSLKSRGFQATSLLGYPVPMEKYISCHSMECMDFAKD